MIEIRNGPTQVPLCPAGIQEPYSLETVSDTPGQVLGNAARHEFAFE
jgi:hypothetical protein